MWEQSGAPAEERNAAMSHVSYVLEFTINDGKLEEFKAKTAG
jgi:hypothetical protein